MGLLGKYMDICRDMALKENMRALILGDREPLSASLKKKAKRLEDDTASGTGLTLSICINYGSRDEMLRAMRSMYSDLKAEGADADSITEERFSSYLDTAGIPDPDFMIRTSGEQRLSNYLMWQLAYAELYFTDVPWPDFDEAEFDRLIYVASAYGVPAIYCTYEFAVKMIPQEAWRYTEGMKEELWRTGRLANYKGHIITILEQGFEDETNSRKVIDPGYCWIIPSGANSKPVKIAFEGNTLVQELDNRGDWSKEIQVYRKVGVVAMLTNDICCYVDTALMGQMDQWFLNGVSGNVITYDGRLDGAVNENGEPVDDGNNNTDPDQPVDPDNP